MSTRVQPRRTVAEPSSESAVGFNLRNLKPSRKGLTALADRGCAANRALVAVNGAVNGEKKSSSRQNGNHYTRSKGPNNRNLKSSDELSLDACAAMLASLDKRAYSRDLLRDANSLLDKLIFPMSFPWTHHLKPSAQAIPHDIDELHGVREAGYKCVDNGSHGRFRPCDDDPNVLASTRRSSDPGVIEYTTFSPPNAAQRNAAPPLHVDSSNNEDPKIAGELSLRMYEEIQARKRRYDEIDSTNLKSSFISVRFGSTSSRSHLFDDVNGEKKPLLLEATLPSVIADGSRSKKNQGLGQSYLGSYDCSFRVQSASKAEHENGRTGRTRLMWSSKDPKASNNRAFISLLTGKPIDNSSHKRPRHVKVGVRLNGDLIVSSSDRAPTKSASGTNPLSAVAEESIDALCSEEAEVTGGLSNQQCTLDLQEFLSNTSFDRMVNHDSGRLCAIQAPFSVSLNTRRQIDVPVLQIKPPKIDCFPCDDGLIYAACSARGSVSVLPTGPPRQSQGQRRKSSSGVNAMCALMDITAIDRCVCSVCWSKTGPGVESDGSSLMTCTGCELTVHRTCYGSTKIPKNGSGTFKCEACLDFDKLHPGQHTSNVYRFHRWRISCSYCKQKGGSLIRQGSAGWVHDVCRTWAASELVPAPFCCICDGNQRPIIQCAAKNCQVMFHPMCALVSSNASDLKRLSRRAKDQDDGECTKSEVEQVIERDTFLCTQFTLAKLEVGSSTEKDLKTIPIAFCGYHNPSRRDDFYGMYPGPERAMRVPSAEVNTTSIDK